MASVARRKKRGAPHPTTSERPYDVDEVEYLKAFSSWKVQNPGRFPTMCDILGLLKGLGYVRVPHGYQLVPIGRGEEVVAVEAARPELRVWEPARGEP